MRPLIRRYSLVVGLILATGGVAAVMRGQDPPTPRLPPVEVLTADSAWRVESASAVAGSDMVYRQWRLADASGRQALLYVGVTARLQTMLRWSGELGYRGDGYVVVDHRDVLVPLGDGRDAPAGEATLQHLSDRRVIQYAMIGPHGIGREGRDLVLGAAWDAVRGRSNTYFMVRVSTLADGGGAATTDLLARVLSRLVAAAVSQPESGAAALPPQPPGRTG